MTFSNLNNSIISLIAETFLLDFYTALQFCKPSINFLLNRSRCPWNSYDQFCYSKITIYLIHRNSDHVTLCWTNFCSRQVCQKKRLRRDAALIFILCGLLLSLNYLVADKSYFMKSSQINSDRFSCLLIKSCIIGRTRRGKNAWIKLIKTNRKVFHLTLSEKLLSLFSLIKWTILRFFLTFVLMFFSLTHSTIHSEP